jgi:hypothetical protein
MAKSFSQVSRQPKTSLIEVGICHRLLVYNGRSL